MTSGRNLEVSSYEEEVDFYLPLLLDSVERGVDGVEFAVTAAFHRNLHFPLAPSSLRCSGKDSCCYCFPRANNARKAESHANAQCRSDSQKSIPEFCSSVTIYREPNQGTPTINVPSEDSGTYGSFVSSHNPTNTSIPPEIYLVIVLKVPPRPRPNGPFSKSPSPAPDMPTPHDCRYYIGSCQRKNWSRSQGESV